MFPWVDGFHWSFGHVLFLSLFFAVVLTILATLVAAAKRTASDLHCARAAELCWKSDFAELPASERRCRHELSGRIPSRTCDNAFDCRHCTEYADFATLPAAGMTHDLGINYSNDRYYHRGHTWVEPQPDGSLTIGLDGLAERLIGSPDAIEMPEIGSEIEVNGTAWRMEKNGNEIRVRAPMEGKVLAVGGPQEAWYIKIQPRLDAGDPATLRHLLRGAEVQWWLYREMERLQMQLRMPNTAPSLADGGVLVNGVMDRVPKADWDTVLSSTFLAP